LATTRGTEPAGRRRRGDARASRAGLSFGFGQLLVGIGAIAVIVSIFLKWKDLSVAGHHSTGKAKDFPIQFLFNYTTRSSNPSLVVILAVSAGLCVLGAVLSSQASAFRIVAGLGGLLAIFTAAMFAFQEHQSLRAFGLGNVHTTDAVGIAPYVALGGGLVALVGAVVPFPKR
jgi:hypothetical protein